MNTPVELPLWAAVLIAALVLIGATLTLIGSIGLLRLENFYQRAHAPTLGSTLGIGCIILASMICFSMLQSRLVLHEVLIAAFALVTTPVTLMLLVRAALYRYRSESAGGAPGPELSPAKKDGQTEGPAPDFPTA